jgi:type III secretion protein V
VGTTDVDVDQYIVFAPHGQVLCPAPPGRELDVGDYADLVRTAMQRALSYKHTRGAGTLQVYLLNRTIERRLASAETSPWSEAERANLLSALHQEIDRLRNPGLPPAILTTMTVRRRLRQLIASEFPALPVLSYQELVSELNIQPVANISSSS